MGKCMKSTKAVIKRAARAIGPLLLAAAGRSVQYIEDMAATDPAWWTSDKKRAAAEAVVRAEARRMKREVPSHLIGLAIEHAVALLNDADEAITPGDLGDATDEEIEAA